MINDALPATRRVEEQSTNEIWMNELFDLNPFRSKDARDQKAPIKEKETFDEMSIEKSASEVANFLNMGRSDLAVALLSKTLMQLDGQSYNRLLVDIVKKEEPETEGDDRGHLLLSEWNDKTSTWDHVYVAERDQLYRIVQPGNTLEGIASDRLGKSDRESVVRYMSNIAEENSLGSDNSISKGQALKLPYPY
jgi:hypothetical protein